jgi:CubicO group peptidase (beta-lactamase class C family)
MSVLDGLSGQLRGRLRSEPPCDLDEAMAAYQTPGVGIAVIEGGRISETRYAGVREVGRPDHVTEQTRFQAGSISKSVAAACALRLVADGLLDLDQDVNDKLRTWRIPANGVWQPRVTLRQLLSHTAGLTVHGFFGYPAGVPVPSVPDVLDGKGNSEPVRVTSLPGLQFSYSGGGYTVMQLLLTDVTGMDFPSLAADLVLDPLGMTYSTYAQPLPADLAREAATGHRHGPVPVTGRWHTYPEMAAAGLWSTASDLARFFVALRASWLGEPGALLPRHLAEQMCRPYAMNQHYGLGARLATEGEPASIGHGGDDEGFQNIARLYLSSGQGAVVMTNSDSGYGVFAQLVLPALADACDWPKAEAQHRPLTGQGPEELAGRYASESDQAHGFLIEARGDELELSMSGQQPLRLRASSNGSWRSDHLQLDIRFSNDGDKRTLVLHQDAWYTTDIEAHLI